ncbi:hypothetical protein FJ251_13425 [bacterium]|nr:hypothetical protein [bacterium]
MTLRSLVLGLSLLAVLLSPLRVAAAEANAPLPFPGPARKDLALPPTLWAEVQGAIGLPGQPIGYAADAMRQFGRDALLLETVRRAFADVSLLPRFAGAASDGFLDEAAKLPAFGAGWEQGGLGEIARRGYLLQDVSAAYRTELAAAPAPALPGEAWQDLPPALRDLLGRLYAGAEAAAPWLRAAFPPELTARACDQPTLDAVRAEDLLALGLALQADEELDQLASQRRESWELLARTDRAYLAYGSVLLLRHVEWALAEFAAAGGVAALPGAPIATRRLATPLGELLLGGTGDDRHETPAFLVVEIGGNDRYRAAYAAPTGLAAPIGLLLDLAGDDAYSDPALADSTLAPAGCFGAAVGGVGLLLDLAGQDDYRVRAAGLGCGAFGSGLLVDYAGDDRYFTVGRWGQGAGLVGLGALVDLAGNDTYSCALESQGIGSTLGTGLLLDLAGNDRYEARDDGNISALYEGQSVAMSQGCGYGRRADLGDGHSLAGGVGLLVDGAGDDDYHAQAWAQGCGYWWGLGILEDRGGNDRYRNGKYSSGAAAHFALGIHVDLAGDDRYNAGNDTAKNQYQGHARDGAIGVFIDGDGNDDYTLRSHCGGSADLASIGLFWDRRGDDRYGFAQTLAQGDWTATPPLGSTTRYAPFSSFRDDLPTLGLFLDTGGHDDYATGGVGKEGEIWTMNRYPRAWGWGCDRAAFAAP